MPAKAASPTNCHKPVNLKSAIEAGDIAALRQLLSEDASRANQLVVWGKNGELETHPLHYISDMLFERRLQSGRALPLVEALLAAGANCNYQAPNGETPLIGAASLGAEDVGLRLLDAGASPDLLGGFRETALHWAANLGLHRLAKRLLEQGADPHRTDAHYHASPLGWAVHGRFRLLAGNQPAVAALLIAAGASVDPDWVADARVQADPDMLAALTSPPATAD